MCDVTHLIEQAQAGDPQAAEKLLPLVYEQLRLLASARMQAERPDHTLQATALVHEAYLRLVSSENKQAWDGRGHFYAAAAEAMRRILINHARGKGTAKRGGDWSRVTLDAIRSPGGIDPAELVAIDDAMQRLSEVDAEAAQVAKLRVFTGLTVPEVADVTGVPKRTVDRHWAFARAWLRTQLAGNELLGDGGD